MVQAFVMASLGEVLRCDDEDAYWCINSKRVDLLLVDADCTPLPAMEYQSGGHHQGTAAARDAVQKEALRRAGVGHVEVVPGDTPTELRRVVERLVRERVHRPAIMTFHFEILRCKEVRRRNIIWLRFRLSSMTKWRSQGSRRQR